MMRLTAYVSGRVQRVGYRAKLVSLASNLGLVGFVQNRPDGRVLVIAEGDKDAVEKFASAIRIENALINVETVDANYSNASGEFSLFRKVTGPDEVGERLDEGIEILKCMLTGINNLTIITQTGFEGLNGKMDDMNCKMDGLNNKMDGANCRMDKMLDKQDETVGEMKGLRRDLKDHMDQRFEYIEGELAEIKSALRVKGII
ncbi:MAG: acylphosphatase [Methanothrix sp.]|nr:acylphosphatase [Methanothrix sp.]